MTGDVQSRTVQVLLINQEPKARQAVTVKFVDREPEPPRAVTVKSA